MTGPLDNPVSLSLLDTDPNALARQLGEAFTLYGFATVKDHGVSQETIARADAATRDFFALPETTKSRYHLPGQGGARGYTPFGVETAKGATYADLKEFWHTGRTLPGGHPYCRYMPPNVWPDEIPAFQPAVTALYEALDRAGIRILSAIARFLGLPSDAFDEAVRDGNSVLRLLHYPPVQGNTPHVRAGAHEDINVITLLLGAEEAGLELQTRDGKWLPIQPPPGALVVNIADMLQRLTNHVLPSTTHRVVNPPSSRAHRSRYSTPFFLHFRPDYEIVTLSSCISAGRPDRYPTPITADAYLQQRLAEIRLK